MATEVEAVDMEAVLNDAGMDEVEALEATEVGMEVEVPSIACSWCR